jgi:hypothetical protein
MKRAAQRVLLALLIGGVLIYGFAMRTGRYQITRMDTSLYLLLDTSTGATWLHRGEMEHGRISFRLESFEPSTFALRRFDLEH